MRRTFCERHAEAPPPYHPLFDALSRATVIRTTARIASTKTSRSLICLALDTFEAIFGCCAKTVTPHFRGSRLVAIEARGDGGQVSVARAGARA
jgi:hypothetical protein